MIERSFNRDKPFLHLPVSDHDPETFHFVQLWDGENLDREFYIGLVDTAAGEKCDFYVAMYLGNLTADTVTLICEDSHSDTLLDGIVPGEDMEKEPELYPDLYREPERQQIHFSPRRGWMNDPNGLLCTEEGFNIHFQHNPFGPQHGCANVSWGRAVSEDGVRFKEYPDSIMPYSTRCHVASGSAILDRYNMSGFGEDTIIAAYTALQSVQFQGRPPVVNEGQHLLYSRDGGKTYQYFPWSPIISVPEGEEWRDPKIVQLDENTLCILVYETYEGKDCVSFYISHDLKEWTRVAREEDLFECPDLFPLKVEETGEILWVLYGGCGKYSVGKFKDYRFTAYSQIQELFLDYGAAIYAGQTFNNPPDLSERRHLAWMCDNKRKWNYSPDWPEHGKGWSQCMSLMCTLKLHKTKDGYRLFRAPVPELKELREGNSKEVLFDGATVLKAPAEYVVTLPEDKDWSLLFGDRGMRFSSSEKEVILEVGDDLPTWMMFGDTNRKMDKKYHLTGEGDVALRIFIDRRSAEVFINDEISMSFSFYPDEETFRIEGLGSIKAEKYDLRSIWDTEE
ncbi:MAG: glycoside hydrolase family 32 protein [Oscillospiraceae bacterium]|nr:glycoside hydrolase family 32 protein [Oscillospiraceae bacterium]